MDDMDAFERGIFHFSSTALVEFLARLDRQLDGSFTSCKSLRHSVQLPARPQRRHCECLRLRPAERGGGRKG